MWLLGLNPGPLEEETVLLTAEPPPYLMGKTECNFIFVPTTTDYPYLPNSSSSHVCKAGDPCLPKAKAGHGTEPDPLLLLTTVP